ncbi:hypothetical protein BIW11_11922, partial [Tropilaelaps mercedesae]
EIINQLQQLGVPVKREGNRVAIGSPSSPQGLTLRVFIKKIDDKPSSVTIMVNDDKYTLPGDEYRLNRYLLAEPEVAYHILRIISTHGVPVEYDAQTKTLKATLASEVDYIVSPTSNRDNSDSHSTGSSGGLVRVMRYGDDITVELGTQSFKLPKYYRKLEKALRENEFSIELIRDSLLRIGIDSRRVGTSLRLLLPGGDAYLSNLPITRQYQYKVESDTGSVKITTGSDTYNLPSDKVILGRAIAEKRVLPRTLVATFNNVGISSEIDIARQEIAFNLPTGLLKIPVPLNISQQRIGSRLRLSVRGPEGNKVYTLTIGDSGEDKVELPSDVRLLNSYIRSGDIDSNLLMQLLGRMGVAHYVDSAKNALVATLNGRPYEIQKSSM